MATNKEPVTGLRKPSFTRRKEQVLEDRIRWMCCCRDEIPNAPNPE